MTNLPQSGFSDFLSSLSPAFWTAIAVWMTGLWISFLKIRKAIGLPMLAVLGTIGFWYFGDVFYNDYIDNYSRNFPAEIIDSAWWQIVAFCIFFLILAPYCHTHINSRLLQHRSHIFDLISRGIKSTRFQERLTVIFWGTAAVWLLLTLVAAARLGSDIIYYFFPFLGQKAEPWSRGRIGGGFDALIAFAGYLQVFVGSSFGVIAALSNKNSIRTMALLGCLLTWPYYLFDRTRNTILATTIPGILAWTFFRFRGNLALKLVLLFCWFFVVEAWLRFVIENRSEMSISTAFQENRFSLEEIEHREGRHDGLNMFEELCWMNTFIDAQTLTPSWGQRYFAEMVNPIPRVLWPGKPLIGIDYALARGQGGGEENEAGVMASVSTGMIGQGLQNFGPWLGPPFAAFLMALWASALARLDLQEHLIGATLLYVMGFVLTFNMGRDITLLTIYPFIFGWILCWWLSRKKAPRRPPSFQKTAQPRQSPTR